MRNHAEVLRSAWMLVAMLTSARTCDPSIRAVVSTAPGSQLAHMPYLKIGLRDLVRIKHQMHDPSLRNPKPSRPPPVIECQLILVNTASPDEKGCLVLADGYLVAVLVRVADTGDEQNREKLSGWQMEAGFGCCAVPVLPLFDRLADAIAWMRIQLNAR